MHYLDNEAAVIRSTLNYGASAPQLSPLCLFYRLDNHFLIE